MCLQKEVGPLSRVWEDTVWVYLLWEPSPFYSHSCLWFRCPGDQTHWSDWLNASCSLQHLRYTERIAWFTKKAAVFPYSPDATRSFWNPCLEQSRQVCEVWDPGSPLSTAKGQNPVMMAFHVLFLERMELVIMTILRFHDSNSLCVYMLTFTCMCVCMNTYLHMCWDQRSMPSVFLCYSLSYCLKTGSHWIWNSQTG